MAGRGESDGPAPAASAPLLAPEETRSQRRQYSEKCPGCRLDEANKTNTGVPYLNFFYIWVVCLTAGTYDTIDPRQAP